MKQNHPLTAETKVIDEHGLMVFDNIHGMPVYYEPFITPYMTIALNIKGWVEAECDMQHMIFKKRDIAVLLANHILYPLRASDDYHAMLIVISPGFQNELKRNFPLTYTNLQQFHYRQDISLTERQFETVLQVMRTIQTISQTESTNRLEMLGNLLEVLFMLLKEYRIENGISDYEMSTSDSLFVRFHKAILEHYKESHEVKFYAAMFNLSPKHFSTTIKQKTGIKALEWINSYITTQAKMMLRKNTQMSIHDVGKELGFSDQATFSRYFRNNTGMSPKDFRAKYR